MTMTVGELRELLADFDDDIEVCLMTQRSWPFENSVHGVTTASAIRASRDNEYKDGPDEDEDEDEEKEVVFIVEGEQLGYGDKNAWNCC